VRKNKIHCQFIFNTYNHLKVILSNPEKSENKKTKSKIKNLYKLLLNSCDKYDKIKESFDEYYEPVKERYQEIIKISPNLICSFVSKYNSRTGHRSR